MAKHHETDWLTARQRAGDFRRSHIGLILIVLPLVAPRQFPNLDIRHRKRRERDPRSRPLERRDAGGIRLYYRLSASS